MVKLNNCLKVCIVTYLVVLQICGRMSLKAGHPADIADVPFIAQIYKEGKFLCPGSWINDIYVLTSSNCFKNVSPAELIVKCDSSRLLDNKIESKIEDIIDIGNGLAILETSLPVSEGKIKHARLYENNLKDGDDLQVYSWGKITTERGLLYHPNQLQTVTLKAVNSSQCSELYGKDFKVPSFCGASPGSGACPDDIGALVVKNGNLAGVVVEAIGCAEPGFPSIHIDLLDKKVVRSLRKYLYKSASC